MENNVLNLLAWETYFPYTVADLDNRPLVILSCYHIGSLRMFKALLPQIIPVLHYHNTTGWQGWWGQARGWVWGISCGGVTLVSLRKVRESNNGPPPPQGGFGVHGCLCVKQGVSQTCMFIKLLPCSQNKDTWVHPGFSLKYSGNWPEVERRDDGSSNKHE